MKIKITCILLIFSFTKLLAQDKELDVLVKNESVYNFVEIQPSFPGGDAAFHAFIYDRVAYPLNAIRNRLGGRIFASFVVEPDGSLSNIKISRSPSQTLSVEVLRILSQSPHWKPAIQNGRPVRCSFTMFVNFDLNAIIDTSLVAKKIDQIDINLQNTGSVNQDPEFKGGDLAFYNYIYSNIKYPASALKTNLQGRVTVSFIVDQDGKVNSITIVKGLSKEIDEEVLRLIRDCPKWKPGIQNGVKTPVVFTIPVNFVLT